MKDTPYKFSCDGVFFFLDIWRLAKPREQAWLNSFKEMSFVTLS